MTSRLRMIWQSYPLTRDMVTFSSLFVGAEFSQQTLLKKIWKVDADSEYDFATMARYSVYGVFVFPVIYNKWYKYLETLYPGSGKSAVIKKIMLDQFLLEPPLIAAFYTGMSAMEGKDDITEEVKLKFIPTFSVGCLFWLPAMSINFLYLPMSARVTFIGVCNLAWCNFLCWLKRQQMTEVSPATE